MKTYYRHWVRESLLKPVTRNWRPTNPPQYEVVYYRGKWTVHFITEFCPILIAEEKTEELAIQRMCGARRSTGTYLGARGKTEAKK